MVIAQRRESDRPRAETLQVVQVRSVRRDVQVVERDRPPEDEERMAAAEDVVGVVVNEEGAERAEPPQRAGIHEDAFVDPDDRGAVLGGKMQYATVERENARPDVRP